MKCLKHKSFLAVMLCIAVICTTCIVPFNTIFAETENIISGKCPVIYGCSDKNSYSLNNNKVRFSAAGNANMEYGYDESNIATKDFWCEKLSALTDGNNSTNIYIRPENSTDSDRVIMVYRFAEYSLESLKLTFDATVKKKVSIFAAKNYSDLYKGNPLYTVNGNYTENSFEIPLNSVKACYISLVFEDAKYKVVEAQLFGTAVDAGESIIKGKTPSMFAPAYDGEFTYNWRQIQYGEATTDKLYGYSEAVPDYKQGWVQHTSKLTDGNDKTGIYVKPESYGNSKRVIIVYELSDLYNFSTLTVKGDSSEKSYSVYISRYRTDLFSISPICEVKKDTSLEHSEGLGGKIAKYIGIVFESPNFKLNEVSLYGEAYVPQKIEDSIISDKVPSMYAPANDGEFTYNWHQIQYGEATADKLYGYSEAVPDRKADWEEHTSKLTDGDIVKGLYIKPEIYGNSKRVVIVYDFSNIYYLDSLNINTDSSAKTYSVYISCYRSDLFNTTPVIELKNDNSTERTENLQSKKARYMGIVLESPNLTVNEISLFGELFVPEPIENSIIAEKIPSMFAPANEGGFTYNWRQIQYGEATAEKLYGYSEDVPGSKEGWSEHTSKLTDGDIETNLFMKTESYGNSKRIVMVYDFSDLYNLDSLSLSGDSSSKTFSVYVSSIRSKLFESSPVCNVTEDNSLEITKKLGGKRAKYIGIVFESPVLTISEISVFGELFVPPAKEKGKNALLGKTPEMYASARAGTYVYNWTMTAYASNGSHYQGYTENDRVSQREFWNTYTANYTDDDESTGTYISPEQRGGWVIAVYNIEDSYVNGFTVKTTSTDNKSIQFFASSDRNSLFTKPIYEVEASKKDIVDDGSINVRAKYIGIAFLAPAYEITEIIVNADAYVRPDYGKSLLSGKLPTTLYVSEREYPLAPSGIEILDIDGTSKKLKNLTDNDFSTSAVWTPWYSAQYPSVDSDYIVTAYDIGDTATLNILRIDSALGGFDVYVSDNFLDIFESKENIVYSSGGDKLTDDKTALDPQTDLQTGEQVINLGGVKGRFIGIVITRTAPSTMENWGNASISEIQLFGTLLGKDMGKNLVSKEEPVSIYRAGYDDYATSQGAMTPQGGSAAYTDGKDLISAIQFPNAGGYINYDNGLIVMVYYLKGNCDISKVNIKSTFYYGIGGVDIYTANSYKDLFKSSNRVFTTEGYKANDGIYDKSKNLGSLQIPVYFDKPVSGRYIAFAFTRISDSNSCGWGLLRLNELEVFGKRKVTEKLPATTITDYSTGSTASFNYQNPDEKFKFAEKGITSFRIVPDSSYSKELFNQMLSSNGYTAVKEPFKIEFLDKKKNVISSDKLAGETVSFDFKLAKSGFCFLGEFIKGGIGVIKFASYKNGHIYYEADSFDKTYVLLKFNSKGAVLNNLSTGKSFENSDFDTQSELFDYPQTDIFDDAVIDNGDIGKDSFEDAISPSDEKKSGGKRWVVDEYDDSFDWFWNIYDTFAANIWMLIVCCGVLILGIDAIVCAIAYFNKRRKRV